MVFRNRIHDLIQLVKFKKHEPEQSLNYNLNKYSEACLKCLIEVA